MKPIPYIAGQAGVMAHQQQQSMSDTLTNGIEAAYDTSRDANGWSNEFEAGTGNLSGNMVRVNGSGGTPVPGSVIWGSGVTKIPHNLGWVPMGWHVTYKNTACDIFAPPGNPPDAQFIYLTNTVPTTDTTLFIF